MCVCARQSNKLKYALENDIRIHRVCCILFIEWPMAGHLTVYIRDKNNNNNNNVVNGPVYRNELNVQPNEKCFTPAVVSINGGDLIKKQNKKKVFRSLVYSVV